jgi:hypothetical protein
VVFLLAVWSVLADDVAMLPLAVLAGSFCAQTHVPYLPITIGLGAVAFLAWGAAFRRARSGPDRSAVLRWAVAAVVLGALLWLPPVVDQLVHHPGNLRRLADHFTNPPEDAVGPGPGLRLTLEHLDLRRIVPFGGKTGWMIDPSTGDRAASAPGAALLLVWAIAVIARWRARARALLRLHALVAAGLAFGLLAMARIFGNLWYYLTLWSWGVTAIVVLSIVQTAVFFLSRRLRDSSPRRTFAAKAGAGALGAFVVLSSGVFAADVTDAPPPAARLSNTLGAVVGPTAQALDARVAGATGHDGRYVVTWEDALHIGSQAYGLVNELERRGFRVGMMRNFRAPLTPYRIVEAKDAAAEIHFATGVNIDPWRDMPNAVEVAFVDPRSPAEEAEFLRLRERAIAALERDGLDDVVPLVDTNLFGAAISPRVPVPTRKLLGRMLDLGEPTAVFLAPPGTTP